ncbi:MAG: hypothetical protein AAGK00_05790 [Pseudomonadota bacterium]
MTRTEIIAKYAAPRWRLLLGSVLSVVYWPFIYIFYHGTKLAWETTSGAAVEPPVIGFMSSYGRASQNGYWIFVFATLALSVFLIILRVKLGAYVGKRLVGVVYVTEVGQEIDFDHISRKSLIMVFYFLVLAIPGPALGFIFGPAADPFSLAALAAGLAFIAHKSWKTDASGRTYAYRSAGIVPVMVRRRESASAELSVSPPG